MSKFIGAVPARTAQIVLSIKTSWNLLLPVLVSLDFHNPPVNTCRYPPDPTENPPPENVDGLCGVAVF